MKKKLSLFVSAIAAGFLVVSAWEAHRAHAQAGDEGAERIFLVRHADKQGYGGNVPLSKKGREQAEVLASKLSDKSITAIYATDSCRTVQTVLPLARSEARTVVVYRAKNYRDFFACRADWESELLDKRLDTPNALTRAALQDRLKGAGGGSVLVADHSEDICGWLETFQPSDPDNCRSFVCPWTDGKRYGDVFILSRSSPGGPWRLDCTSLNFRLAGEAPN